MSGAHVGDEIDACVDGALTEVRRQAVLAHAQACVECGAALERASRLQRALGQIPVPDPGRTYWSEFTARVEARVARPAIAAGTARGAANFYERVLGWVVQPSRFGWAGVVGAVAAATLVVYVGLRGFQPRDAHVQVSMPAPAPAPAPEPAPVSRDRSTLPAPAGRADAPAPGTPFAANAPVQGTRRKSANVPAPAPPVPEDHPAPAKANDELRTTGKAAAITVGEAPAAKADEQAASSPVNGFAALEKDKDARRDPVVDFLQAAIAGDSTAANATYAALTADGFAGVTPADAERLRSWAAAPVRQASGASEKSFAVGKMKQVLGAAPRSAPQPPAARAPSALAAPQVADASRPAFDAGTAVLPHLEPLLALEALAWPRRADATLRPALAALAEKLAHSAPNDARAAARATALADWLAQTSTSRQERDQWDTLRQNIPQR